MMKSDLPSPLRVGVWGAVSYIVGNVVYRIVIALFGLISAVIGVGLMLLGLWLATSANLIG